MAPANSQLEIDAEAIKGSAGHSKFNFDILLRDKFPFQPPLIQTKSNFGTPSLADGRDLLLHVLPKGRPEWMPSMNLSDLIKQIPDFIRESLARTTPPQKMVGRFHLGLSYDMLLWMSNSDCGVFPCQEEQLVPVERKDAQGRTVL